MLLQLRFDRMCHRFAVLIGVAVLVSRFGWADEWTANAQRLLQLGLSTGLTPITQQQQTIGLELSRGALLEDDGAAAGFSYRPNEERLDGKTVVRKQLLVSDPRATQAFLLIAPGGQLEAVINGQPVTLTSRGKAGNYWEQYEFPVSALKSGLNDFVIKGKGKVWIARHDDLAPAKAETQRPNRSAKSLDDGVSWSSSLGPKNDIEGEYYVRVFLEQHVPRGSVTLPTLDLLNLKEALIAPDWTEARPATLRPVQLRLKAKVADGQQVAVSLRFSHQPTSSGTWTDWEPVAIRQDENRSDELIATITEPQRRVIQVRIELKTMSPTTSPTVHSISLASNVPAAESRWWELLQPRLEPQRPIVRSSIPFEYEPTSQPILEKLRREQRLDQVVAGAVDEFEQITRLAAWSSQRWQKGHLSEIYPAWNACEILQPHRDGTPVGGFCQQYNLVFLQACECFGLVGRAVSIGPGEFGAKIRSGHEVVEIWSNQHRRWVYVDGDAAWYFVDQQSRAPLSLRELRRRQLLALRDQAHAAVELVPINAASVKPRYEWKGLTGFPAFVEMRLIPRSNFLAQPQPLPLNQGMRGWFWTGHFVWTDHESSAARLYGQRESVANNWDWTVNQVEARLFGRSETGHIRVVLEHNTPNFKNFYVRHRFSDAEGPKSKEHYFDESTFEYQLLPGDNRVSIAAVNQAGRHGAPTTIWFNPLREKQ